MLTWSRRMDRFFRMSTKDTKSFYRDIQDGQDGRSHGFGTVHRSVTKTDTGLKCPVLILVHPVHPCKMTSCPSCLRGASSWTVAGDSIPPAELAADACHVTGGCSMPITV